MKNNYLGKEISELYRIGNAYLAKVLPKYGIGVGQQMFLAKLYREQGITQDELSERIHIDKATTARALKKLEDNGYILRVKCEDDKRVNNVFLTDKAVEFEPVFWDILNEWNSKLTENLSDNEKELLFNLLGRISVNAHEYSKGGSKDE